MVERLQPNNFRKKILQFLCKQFLVKLNISRILKKCLKRFAIHLQFDAIDFNSGQLQIRTSNTFLKSPAHRLLFLYFFFSLSLSLQFFNVLLALSQSHNTYYLPNSFLSLPLTHTICLFLLLILPHFWFLILSALFSN